MTSLKDSLKMTPVKGLLDTEKEVRRFHKSLDDYTKNSLWKYQKVKINARRLADQTYLD